jgi:hypothetical protein
MLDKQGTFSETLSLSNLSFKFQLIDENKMKIKTTSYPLNDLSIFLSISLLFSDGTIKSFQEQIHFSKSIYEHFLHFPIKLLSINKILFEISNSPISSSVKFPTIPQPLNSHISSINSHSNNSRSLSNISPNQIFNLKEIHSSLTLYNILSPQKPTNSFSSRILIPDLFGKLNPDLSFNDYSFQISYYDSSSLLMETTKKPIKNFFLQISISFSFNESIKLFQGQI